MLGMGPELPVLEIPGYAKWMLSCTADMGRKDGQTKPTLFILTLCLMASACPYCVLWARAVTAVTAV